MTAVMEVAVRHRAARQLAAIVGGDAVAPEDVAVSRVASRDRGLGYVAEARVDVVQFRAEFTALGLRSWGWEARRDPTAVAERGWLRRLLRRVRPPARHRWRTVSRLADVAELL